MPVWEVPYSSSNYPYTDEPEQDVKSIDRSKKFVSDMMKMLLDGSSNDVCIKLHDGEIKANINVLAARCEYFAATFRWKSNNNHDVEEIVISDCSKKIMTLIMEYLFSGIMKIDDLSLLELLQLKDQVRKLLPGEKLEEVLEEYLNSSGSDIFTNSVQDRCNFFPTNEEIVKTLSLVESGNLQMLDPEEIGKIFETPGNCEEKIASLASFVYNGVLQEVSELLLYSNKYEDEYEVQKVQFDLRFVPSDHLKALIPCVRDYIEITNITGYDLTSLFDSVSCTRLKVTQKLNQEETDALLRAMTTRVEEVCLGDRYGELSLDVDTLTQYKGDGKCSVIRCNLLDEWIGIERTERWAGKMKWSVEITDSLTFNDLDDVVFQMELRRTKTTNDANEDCDLSNLDLN